MMAQDALVAMFDSYMQDRQAIPEASSVYGQPCVVFPVILAGKIALYNAMLAVHMSHDDLALLLDITQAELHVLVSDP